MERGAREAFEPEAQAREVSRPRLRFGLRSFHACLRLPLAFFWFAARKDVILTLSPTARKNGEVRPWVGVFFASLCASAFW
jgi:hypothetical protein